MVRPEAVTSSKEKTLSQAQPYLLEKKDMPPPRVRPPTPIAATWDC
jgi:hypothetical protein